ncbi:hypothetical protein CDAR_555671 [Caerostris darwini]|uniref:Uncharacterized protein n=1 Tax=Caerostris darwini TaxID=1538125 RepID=A0AAV4QYQ6_9ARAC|nr:hypothetical protein CDAR_555671 [Caerostris darwini]
MTVIKGSAARYRKLPLFQKSSTVHFLIIQSEKNLYGGRSRRRLGPFCTSRNGGLPSNPSSSSVTRRGGSQISERKNRIEHNRRIGGGRVDLRLIGNVASIFHQPEEWLEWN